LPDTDLRSSARAVGLEPADVGAQPLGALHHLELDVLEGGLPARERVNLVLESLQVLGGSLACVHPLLVANAAFADELDVGVGLDDLALDVAQRGLRADQVVAAGGELGVEGLQLGKLRQGRLAVGDLVQARVQRLEVQQPPLTARVGFQGVPPVVSLVWSLVLSRVLTLVPSLGVAPVRKSHGSVRSVQM
jgi:hypothetical protein